MGTGVSPTTNMNESGVNPADRIACSIVRPSGIATSTPGPVIRAMPGHMRGALNRVSAVRETDALGSSQYH